MAWIDRLLRSETLPVLEASMGFAQQRHLVLMNNIANIETPFYKRQDVAEGQFLGELRRAIEERRQRHGGDLQMNSTRDIRFEDGAYPRAMRIAGREWGPERHDENSVTVEKEMAELAKNALHMEILQRLFKQKLTTYRSALRERVA